MTLSAQAGYHRNLRREWLVLSLLMLGLVAWLCLAGGLRRMDYLVQDAGTRLYAHAAHPDIVIVAVDDRSIASIGRWPWRRALHAQLVDQITAQSPRALGLDILFGEEDADYPGDDLLLARAPSSAMCRCSWTKTAWRAACLNTKGQRPRPGRISAPRCCAPKGWHWRHAGATPRR